MKIIAVSYKYSLRTKHACEVWVWRDWLASGRHSGSQKAGLGWGKQMIKCLPGHTWLWVTAWKRENKMGPQANDFQVCWPSCLATGE